MKLKKLVSLCLAIIMGVLVLSACSSSETTTARVYLRADVTHDGEKDRIVSYLTDAEDGKAKVTVQVTDANNKNVFIYEERVGTKDNDQKGIYLCNKSKKYDIMVWKPTVKGDKTKLEYAVFYLDFNKDSGEVKKVLELQNEIEFTKEQVAKGGDKYDQASCFILKLNSYIKKSRALIDTVGGELSYTPKPDQKINKPYYPDWFDKNYREDRVESTESSNSSSKSDVVSSQEESTVSENNTSIINH